MTIEQRIEALRERMRTEGLSAYIIPSGDPHQSEYPPDHWKCRQWISGFHGSAGTVVVTMDTAGLWTDPRYYLEAEEVLDGTPIELFRAGRTEVPEYTDWLSRHLPRGARVGFDAAVVSLETARSLTHGLTPAGIDTIAGRDLIDELWQDRPPLPSAAAYLPEQSVFGETRREKLARLRSAIEESGARIHVMATLDDIAWTLNLRGGDVAHNPVALAYLVVHPESAVLFIDPAKLGKQDRKALESDGLTLEPYEGVGAHLGGASADTSVLYDPRRVSAALADSLAATATPVERQNPSTAFKARKNETELGNLRACMVTDGVAMSGFLHWLEANAQDGGLGEREAARKLKTFRSASAEFVGESFETIAGYGGHGAIVHYRVTPETDAPLRPGGLLLLDSGGQYRIGTTDITRTVPIGEPTERMRRDFTLVLKAHIALATTVFPEGTSGHQLDAIPRRVLWQEGMNYGHGTGHGVGFFLNVHEGPQRISSLPNTVPLEPGMVLSNEPGLYRRDEYGIRIENLLVVTEPRETSFGRFLGFETLTLCPIEPSLIEPSLLTGEERAWLDDYHETVRRSLEGGVDSAAREWLREKTRPL
ncbi:MAG: aminopeptidase P family protein [Spirochaetaceae bacterium]